MIRFLLPLTAAAVLASTGAYSQTATDGTPHPHHKKQPPVAAEPAVAVPVAPEVAQWFGKAVDDMLTDTSKVLDPDAKR